MTYFVGDLDEHPGGDLKNLIQNLQSPNVDMRWRAARSLGERGESAVDALIPHFRVV